jgi:hypothetical protein
MSRVPTPLTWRRRSFAVLEPLGLIDRRTALAVSGVIAGPFAIYPSVRGMSHTLIHLPTQAKIIDLDMQNLCKHAAERFAALDLNWWTCIPEEVIGPDLEEMRNIHAKLKPDSYLSSDIEREWRGEE